MSKKVLEMPTVEALMQPKKETLQNILNFSKSIEVKGKSNKIIIHLN